jgi:hypothetical protein
MEFIVKHILAIGYFSLFIAFTFLVSAIYIAVELFLERRNRAKARRLKI